MQREREEAPWFIASRPPVGTVTHLGGVAVSTLNYKLDRKFLNTT